MAIGESANGEEGVWLANSLLMIEATELAKLDDAARGMVEQLLQRIERDAREISKRDAEINWRDAKIEKLTFEIAQLKRLKQSKLMRC